MRTISSKRGRFQDERHWHIRLMKIIQPAERTAGQDFRGNLRLDLRVIMSADFLFTIQGLTDSRVVVTADHKEIVRRESLWD